MKAETTPHPGVCTPNLPWRDIKTTQEGDSGSQGGKRQKLDQDQLHETQSKPQRKARIICVSQSLEQNNEEGEELQERAHPWQELAGGMLEQLQ